MSESSSCPNCGATLLKTTNVCVECGHHDDAWEKSIAIDNELGERAARREWLRSVRYGTGLFCVFAQPSRTRPLGNPFASLELQNSFGYLLVIGIVGFWCVVRSDAHWAWKLAAILSCMAMCAIPFLSRIELETRERLSSIIAVGLGMAALIQWVVSLF